VGSPTVQRTLGALHSVDADHAIIVTTSYFTVSAEEQAEGAPIELWDKEKLRSMVRKHIVPKKKPDIDYDEVKVERIRKKLDREFRKFKDILKKYPNSFITVRHPETKYKFIQSSKHKRHLTLYFPIAELNRNTQSEANKIRNIIRAEELQVRDKFHLGKEGSSLGVKLKISDMKKLESLYLKIINSIWPDVSDVSVELAKQ